MDRELLLENIVRYCQARDEPPTKACINAGVGKDFIGSVRSGKVPSVAKVMALAAYLGVTTSDLVGDAKDAPPSTQESASFARFIVALEGLGPEQQEAVLSMLETIARGNTTPPAAPR